MAIDQLLFELRGQELLDAVAKLEPTPCNIEVPAGRWFARLKIKPRGSRFVSHTSPTWKAWAAKHGRYRWGGDAWQTGRVPLVSCMGKQYTLRKFLKDT